MKFLKVLIAVSVFTFALVSSTAQADARPRAWAYTAVPVNTYAPQPTVTTYVAPTYVPQYAGASYGPQYDVWGRLVGSDPNHPIFAPGAENLQWNTPNNFPPYTTGYPGGSYPYYAY
jgi:hypothetical protein